MLETIILALEKPLNFIKKHLIIIISALLLITTCYLALNYSLLKITVTGLEENENVTITSLLNNKRLRNGYNLVKKGDLQIQARTDSKETVTRATINLFKKTNTNITLKNSKHVDTFVYDTRGSTCGFGKTIAYECRYSNIYAQNPVQEFQKSRVLPTVNLIQNQLSYKDGIVSLAAVGDPGRQVIQLIFTDGRTVKTIDQSQERYTKTQSKNLIASADSEDFAVNDSAEKVIYLYRNVNDSTPITYKYQTDLPKNTSVFSVSLVKGNLYLRYDVQKAHTHVEGEDEETHSDAETYVSQYRVAENTVQKLKTYNITKISGQDDSFNSVSGSSGNTVSALTTGETFIHIELSDTPRVISKLEDVVSYIQHNQDLYYRQGGKIYQLDTKSGAAYLLAQSSSSSIKNMWFNNNLLVFSASNDKTPSVDSMYVVTEKDRTEVEPFDILPYDPASLPVVSSRYYGNTIYIAVDLDSLYRKEDLKPIYKNSEYQQKKATILERLKKDGINTSKYTIVFSPGPVASNSIIVDPEFTGDSAPLEPN